MTAQQHEKTALAFAQQRLEQARSNDRALHPLSSAGTALGELLGDGARAATRYPTTTQVAALERVRSVPRLVRALSEQLHGEFCSGGQLVVLDAGRFGDARCPWCAREQREARFHSAMLAAQIEGRYLDVEWADLELLAPLDRVAQRCAQIDTLVRHGANLLLWGEDTGTGKCLGRGTPVLMHDGRVKPVEDVVAGDLVMGPDSAPRRVLRTVQGQEELYRVIPIKGEPYVVNASHILSLQMSAAAGGFQAGEIVNISVVDYFAQTAAFRSFAKGYRVGVDFAPQPTEMDPYFLGLWLGDGDANAPTITKPDPEIFEYLVGFASSMGMSLSVYHYSERCPRYALVTPAGQANPLTDALRKLRLNGNKHVPHAFKANSRAVRLAVLAGLMDSDGSLSGNGYDFISKSEALAHDVAYLARSLGMAAYVKPCEKRATNGKGGAGVFYRVSISGATSEIPVLIPRKRAAPRQQIKDVLKTGIRLEPLGRGDYFGFSLEGQDRRFLLGDFTVTHNTQAAMLIGKAAIRAGHSVAVHNMARLALSVRESYRDRSEGALTEEAALKALTAPDLLILDDLGAGESDSAAIERRLLFLALNERQMHRKPTVATTNLALVPPKEAEGKRRGDRAPTLVEVLGARVFARLQPLKTLHVNHGKNFRALPSEVSW